MTAQALGHKWERLARESNQRTIIMPVAETQKRNAEQALKEAETRRQAAEAEAKATPVEKGGRNGPDPARYGDWEVKGITSDF